LVSGTLYGGFNVKKIKTHQEKNRKVGGPGLSLSGSPAERKVDPKKIVRYGEVVFSVFWDSGAPGAGADYELILKWRGSYAARLSFDEPKGPYGSLVEAVKRVGLNGVTNATVSVESQELRSEHIAKMLRYIGEPPFGLRINGEIWLVSRDKKFVRKSEESQP
jgi:hypothetical protein